MKSSKINIRMITGVVAGAALTVTAYSMADSIVEVTPANLNGWTLNSFDASGNIVNSGPYLGTAALVTGPATPPLGVGSAQLATPVGAGDGAAAIATESYDGTLLTSITALSYSAYDVTNNGQQFPYLALSIAQNDGSGNTDTLFFEPPYQTPSTGSALLPDQGATVQNVWQSWNAYVGGWWDNNGLGSPGTGVVPLATFETAYPLATIANGGLPGLGGIALQVGFGSSGDTEDGYVDALTVGVGGVNTTYDFEPNAVPEPASFSLIGVGAALLMRRRRRA
jgi:PEP-CTERM motif